MLVIRGFFRQTKGPLAAPVQVSEQTVADMPVDLAKRVSRISKLEVVAPAFQVPIEPINQFRYRLMALMTVRHLRQLVPLPLQRLLRRPHMQVLVSATVPVALPAECVAQKVQTCLLLAQIKSALD